MQNLFLLFHAILFSRSAVCVSLLNFSSSYVGIDITYRPCGYHVSSHVAGLETGTGGPQTALVTARRERLNRLWSRPFLALWERIPETDTTAHLLRGSRVGTALHNNAWVYVARGVIKNTREHLCNLLDTYLPRVVKKQVGRVEG